ncbi:MAG TPA: hypothetical protein VGF69_08935 [Thermoanaerobaculia bacterium]|jgi:hypothetical protein
MLLVSPPRRAAFAGAFARWVPLELLRAGAAARRAGMEVSLYDAHNRDEGLEAIRFVISYQQPDVIVLPPGADVEEIEAIAQSATFDGRVCLAEESDDEPAWELVDWSFYPHHAIEGSIFAGVESMETMRLLHARFGVNVFQVPAVEFIDGSLGARFIAAMTVDEVLHADLSRLREAGLVHVRLDADEPAAIARLREAGIVSETRAESTTTADLGEFTCDEAYRDFYSAKVRALEDAPHDYLHACVQAMLRSRFFHERMRRLVPAALAPRKNRGHLALF